MEEIIDSYIGFAKNNPIYLLYSGLYYLLSVSQQISGKLYIVQQAGAIL